MMGYLFTVLTLRSLHIEMTLIFDVLRTVYLVV